MRFNKLSLLAIIFLIAVACSEDDPLPQTDISVTVFEADIDENPQSGQLIGTIEVLGAEGTISFSLGEQNPVGAMAIDAATGELSVADPEVFNFEINPVVTALVTVNADNGTATGSITVDVNNVDESDLFTIWLGPAITFAKADGSSPALEANQDRITEDVWITRGNDGGQIYNAKTESVANSSSSPAGTKWAFGQVEEIEALTFTDFRTAVGRPRDVVGKDLVLYLEAEDAYLAVKFNSWSTGKAGGFTYTRATQN